MHQKLYIRNDRCFGNNFQKVVADKWHYFVRFIFIVFCSSVTFYFIFGSVEIFLKNEDSSKVIYRKFDDNDATESVYPMISVRIVTFQNKSLIDPEKSAMNKSEIRNYQMAMMGELKYEERKFPESFDFEDVAIHLKDYFDSFEVEDINNDVIYKWKNSSDHEESFPFNKIYQDPQTMCFSWNSHDASLSYVKLYILKNTLRKIANEEHEYYIYLYLTINNQLIRNMLYLHKEDFWQMSEEQYNHIRIDVTGISLLRLRHDANMPCDRGLKNDDMNWMNHVINENGCIPMYWDFLGHNKSIPMCNETNQYKKFTKYFARSHRRKVYNVFDKYNPPCTHMRILTSIKFLKHYEKEKYKVDVRTHC